MNPAQLVPENADQEFAILLEAIEALGDELSARNAGDLSFSVTEPDDCPAVTVLASLINKIGADWSAYIANENAMASQRAKELADAYNAVQSKSDEMMRDLETARRIQLRLIPQGKDFPTRSEVSCAGYYQSMENVGGDLYDVIRIGRNSYGILMADVSGHGLPSALITALVKVAFRTKARWGIDPAITCSEVNTELYPILSDLDYFVTAFYGVLNIETGNFQYVNCGHHPALLLPAGDTEMSELETPGRFLGAFDIVEYQSSAIDLSPGDTIFTYTDGIIEMRNFLDEEYGTSRLADSLEKAVSRASNGSWALAVVDGVRKDLEAFTMGAPVRDDQSMLAFQFHCTCDPEIRAPNITPDQKVDHAPAVAHYLVRQAATHYKNKQFLASLSLIEAAALLNPPRPLDLLLEAWTLHELGQKQNCATLIHKLQEYSLPELSKPLKILMSLQD